MNSTTETATTNAFIEIKYAGFWKRLASQLLDALILSPLVILAYLFYNQKIYYYFYCVIGVLIGLFYQVYLVQKYGGTPGKRIMKIEIKKLDLSKVTYKEAGLRYSVLFALSLTQNIAMMVGISNLSDSELANFSYVQFALKLAEVAPPIYSHMTTAIAIWFWSECIIIFFNKKKRAPHDFIAGTVVVESAP